MKQCPICGMYAEDYTAFCPRCSADLTNVPPVPPQATVPRATPPAPTFTPRMPGPSRKLFTWADVATFLGFCASIVGYFGASLLFFPLGIIASVLGFKGNRARGLAVAGIVIATLELLLKLMVVMQQWDFLPRWFTSGVW